MGETGVEASDDGECFGEPRPATSTLELSIVTESGTWNVPEFRVENETQIDHCELGAAASGFHVGLANTSEYLVSEVWFGRGRILGDPRERVRVSSA